MRANVAGEERNGRVRRAAALVLVAGLLLVPTAGSRAASSQSAVALLNRAFADARAKGSFHQALTQVTGRVRGSLDDDVTLTTGRQAISSSDGTRARIEVIGKTAYVSGNEHALVSFFKFTSTQAAVIGSNWVPIPSSDSAYASVAYDVTVPTALAEVAPSGHLTEGSRTTIGGQQVIAISGGLPAPFAGGKHGRATIYVTASSDPLPVRASVQAVQAGNTRLTLTGTMDDWGEHVTVAAPSGRQLSAGQVNRLVHKLAGLAIRGEPGYFAVDGEHGHPVSSGRPWGEACKPVRFAIGSSVPGPVYRQIAAVVAAARRQGIDVTAESRDSRWSHGSLYYRDGQTPATAAQVNVVATGPTPATGANAMPIELTADSRLDGDRRSEDLTSLTGALSLPLVDGHWPTLRRAIRRLIAASQGIGESTDAVSGIAQRGSSDRFTRGDVAAMLAMSGCHTPVSNTVIGIAA